MIRTPVDRAPSQPGGAVRDSGYPSGLSPQEIITTHARTSFSFAARFLPQPQRNDAVDLYAFFRTLDDLVDESPRADGTAAITDELDAWQDWLITSRESGPREPLAGNLARIIDEYSIPIEIFQQMLAGLRADIEPREIATEAELQLYCYQVASTVGYAMAHVLGATSPQALSAAEKLGAAMQLTNILRDIGEDLDAGRIYVPRSLLAQYGLCRADLLLMQHELHGPDNRFRRMMHGQICYARTLYQQAIPGIWLLPDNCRLPILVATRLYRRLLMIIERNNYDTLRLRTSTTHFDKAQEAIISWTLVTRARMRKRPAPEPASPRLPGSALETRCD